MQSLPTDSNSSIELPKSIRIEDARKVNWEDPGRDEGIIFVSLFFALFVVSCGVSCGLNYYCLWRQDDKNDSRFQLDFGERKGSPLNIKSPELLCVDGCGTFEIEEDI